MIDWFMGGKPTKAKKVNKVKKAKDPLFDLMIKPSSSIIGDRVTKKQKKVFKKAKKQKSFMPMFGDWDGDGVINGLDCQPRNKKKHMAWRKPEPYEYTQEMTPREYLSRAGSPNFGLPEYETGKVLDWQHRYYDDDTKKSENINKLGGYITDPNKEVEFPFVEPDTQHEGRHRAFAAEQVGIKKIPVRLPPPQSWRTKEIQDSFIQKRYPYQSDPDRQDWQKEMDKRDNKKWKNRIKTDNFPEQTLDRAGTKAYSEAVQESFQRPKDPGAIKREKLMQELFPDRYNNKEDEK